MYGQRNQDKVNSKFCDPQPIIQTNLPQELTDRFCMRNSK